MQLKKYFKQIRDEDSFHYEQKDEFKGEKHSLQFKIFKIQMCRNTKNVKYL